MCDSQAKKVGVGLSLLVQYVGSGNSWTVSAAAAGGDLARAADHVDQGLQRSAAPAQQLPRRRRRQWPWPAIRGNQHWGRVRNGHTVLDRKIAR